MRTSATTRSRRAAARSARVLQHAIQVVRVSARQQLRHEPKGDVVSFPGKQRLDDRLLAIRWKQRIGERRTEPGLVPIDAGEPEDLVLNTLQVPSALGLREHRLLGQLVQQRRQFPLA